MSIKGKIYGKICCWGCGCIWKSWCRDVLPPVTDAFRLWFSGEHCRLGSGRWRTTKNAGFTTVLTKIERIVRHLEYQLHRGNPLQWYRKEEQVQSVLELTWEKAWCQVRLRNRVHRKKLAALFSLRCEEPENQFMSSVFKKADPSNWGRSLLECNKDHLLSQARSAIVKQEHHVDSPNNCISELQQQTHAQRLELQDAQHGFVESRWEQVRLQEELSMKEKSSARYSNPKHARNGRHEESSKTTSRWSFQCNN